MCVLVTVGCTFFIVETAGDVRVFDECLRVHLCSPWWQHLELCMGSTAWERWHREYCNWLRWWYSQDMEMV